MTHGALFAGLNVLGLAFKQLGVETLWSSETDSFRRELLNKNFPKTRQYGDIRAIENLPYVDIISGGFPCQDISGAGPGHGIRGARSSLCLQCPMSYPKPVQNISSLRTPLCSSREGSSMYCSTLPKSGMMQSGAVFELPISAIRTKERGSFSLLTPTASDALRKRIKLESLAKRYQRHPNGNLSEQLAGKYGIRLTAKFCEMMMGVPSSWTELKL